MHSQSDLKNNNTKTVQKSQPDTLKNNNTIVVTGDTLKTVTTDSLDTDEGEPLGHKIVYNAKDSIRYETKGNRILLFGDAYVEYESMNLKSEFIEIDNEKSLITAYGKKDSLGNMSGTPLFKEGQQTIEADKIIYNMKTRRGKIFNVSTKEGDLVLLGSEVKKDSNDVVYMRDLRCIPCEFKDARTVFRAKKAKIIPNDKIVTGPMYLEIGGVPTPLGLPFGFFPNTKKRHSGLLLPFYGNSQNLGFYLKDGGFYWGISDKTDMIIRGDIYSNGSWGLRTTNNYNINYKFQGALSLGFSEFRTGEKEIPSQYSKQRDISITWRHIQDQRNNPSIRFSSDVNIRTSKYNKYNALNTGQYLTNTFQSNISFIKMYKSSSININARHSQNTQTKIMELSFPELTFTVNRFYPFKREGRIKQNAFDKLGISYLLEARNTLTGYDTAIFKGNIADKLKYGVRHSLPISTNISLFKYFTLTPALNLSAVMYTKTTSKNLDVLTNTINIDTVNAFKTGYDANFNTSLTTKVFMDYLFKSRRIKQIRHLLIPTINYTYRPDFGAKQYGFYKDVMRDTVSKVIDRYSVFENTLFGGPVAGEQNSIGVNLSNNIEAKIRKRTDTGYVYNKAVILQNLSFTGSYNFAADSMRMSNIGMTGRTKIWKFFDLVFNSTFNPYYYNAQLKRVTSEYSINSGGHLVRFTNGDIAISANLSSASLQTIRPKKPDLTNGAEQGAVNTNTAQAQQRLPWNLNVYYKLAYQKIDSTGKLRDIQSLNFSGDIAITKYWKLGITSGYDFTNRNLSYTSVNLYRDMRCWEARIDWVPFGFRKSYSITINLKTSMLSDIKLPRQRQWYDNF